MTIVLLCVLALFATGVAGGIRSHAPDGAALVYGASLALCVLIGVTGAAALGSESRSLTLPLGLPWTGARFRLDALAGFFLLIIGVGGAGASLYAIGYARHEKQPQRVLPFYPAFLAAMTLVVIADDAFTFLFAWELMSLASWALVVSGSRSAEAVHAGYVYLVMASLSGLLLLFAFGLLAGPGGEFGFAGMRAAPATGGTAAAALMLALAGAGSKAGLMPLHAWLPLAHPAAPSHVSALMSGVMTKVAVYGFVRIAFDLLHAAPWWGAVVVLAAGGATAVLGILYALMQSDLKRLLAYSTVENIGIIFIGLGLALGFRFSGFAAGAALALTAALFHAINHTVFKSLLFFGAGAVLNATGLRSLEQMGGLIHRMPRTAAAVLVGCAAIAALPPLNGFASEWLTFQAVLLRPDLPQWGLKVMIPTDGALLALTAALAAACFVKVFGIGFLGRPRSLAASQAQEVDGWMVSAMFAAAALCLLGGVLPGLVIDALSPAVQMLVGGRMPAQMALPWLSVIPVQAARSSYNGLLIAVFVTAVTSLTALALHRFASRRVRRAPAWDCGFPDADPATQYTAGSFAQPLRRVFGSPLFGASDVVTMPPPGDTAPALSRQILPDPIWDWLYAPLARGVGLLADVMNRLQFLTIRRYLGFVFATLVLLLLALTAWQ